MGLGGGLLYPYTGSSLPIFSVHHFFLYTSFGLKKKSHFQILVLFGHYLLGLFLPVCVVSVSVFLLVGYSFQIFSLFKFLILS